MYIYHSFLSWLITSLVCFTIARSRDNTWPEELMAVMKEMEKQELDQEKQVEKDTKSQGTVIIMYMYNVKVHIHLNVYMCI